MTAEMTGGFAKAYDVLCCTMCQTSQEHRSYRVAGMMKSVSCPDYALAPKQMCRKIHPSFLATADGEKSFDRDLLLACPSQTCYANSKPHDVVVIEPPHRGDRCAQPRFPA